VREPRRAEQPESASWAGIPRNLMITAAEGTPVKVIWLDAYGTPTLPKLSVSGCFDGVALAAATGRCANLLQRTLARFQRCQSYDYAAGKLRADCPASMRFRSSLTIFLTLPGLLDHSWCAHL